MFKNTFMLKIYPRLVTSICSNNQVGFVRPSDYCAMVLCQSLRPLCSRAFETIFFFAFRYLHHDQEVQYAHHKPVLLPDAPQQRDLDQPRLCIPGGDHCPLPGIPIFTLWVANRGNSPGYPGQEPVRDRQQPFFRPWNPDASIHSLGTPIGGGAVSGRGLVVLLLDCNCSLHLQPGGLPHRGKNGTSSIRHVIL